MNSPTSDQMDVDMSKPNADLNKAFYMHKELDTDLKQVEDQVADLDLKGLSMTSKEKKAVQFSSPLFAVSSEMRSHTKGKALSDAASTGSVASKLKKQKKRARVQIGKIYTSKRKLNFSCNDGQDDVKDDVQEKDLDLDLDFSLNETC